MQNNFILKLLRRLRKQAPASRCRHNIFVLVTTEVNVVKSLRMSILKGELL